MINRNLAVRIKAKMHGGKTILLIGARQVGKTTLIEQLLADKEYLFLDGDDPGIIKLLDRPDRQRIQEVIGGAKIVFIDEAQRIPGIGITLKIMTDRMKDVQVIASGSSALELRSLTEESLTGRKWTFHLYPVSWEEWQAHIGFVGAEQDMENRLIFGMYPDVLNRPLEREGILKELTSSYLYQDVLALGQVQKPEAVVQLLQALSYQVGQEVNYNELSRLLKIDFKTVTTYIDLLEKAEVIFRLPAFSRNLRNEISLGRKVYFYDNGVRNAVIGDFRLLPLRQDVGALWENFLISERRKNLSYHESNAIPYFWRTAQQQEVDYLEVENDAVRGYEIKWNPRKQPRFPKTFTNAYGSENMVVTRENFREFLSKGGQV